jgi:hypothetical protein
MTRRLHAQALWCAGEPPAVPVFWKLTLHLSGAILSQNTVKRNVLSLRRSEKGAFENEMEFQNAPKSRFYSKL